MKYVSFFVSRVMVLAINLLVDFCWRKKTKETHNSKNGLDQEMKV
jgi:hypothetical protein